MRSLALVTSFVIATTVTSSVWAQRSYQRNVRPASYSSYNTKPISYKTKINEFSLSDRIIYERALYRAHSRTARIQARKWAGISLSRPSLIRRDFQTPNVESVYWNWDIHRTPVWSNYSIR